MDGPDVGKDFLKHLPALVGAAMCPACSCGLSIPEVWVVDRDVPCSGASGSIRLTAASLTAAASRRELALDPIVTIESLGTSIRRTSRKIQKIWFSPYCYFI